MSPEKRAAIRERLQSIASLNDGLLTPELVVQDARSKDSPLHDQFEWDVKKAAQNHWIDRARTLIRSVKVELTEEKVWFKAPYWVHDPDLEQNDQGYRSMVSVRSDEDKARAVIVQEFARAAGAIRRARDVARALSMEESMDSLLNQIEEVRASIQEPARA